MLGAVQVVVVIGLLSGRMERPARGRRPRTRGLVAWSLLVGVRDPASVAPVQVGMAPQVPQQPTQAYAVPVDAPAASADDVHGFGLERFIESPLHISDGLAQAPDRPGHGVAFDFDALSSLAS